jgi:ATP-dependent helicase/nuclease subunit A
MSSSTPFADMPATNRGNDTDLAELSKIRITQATALQHQASDPQASAWVSANAGSGKTHVLVQRIIRLLLQKVEPNKILALTYTKAAAANMATRVFDTLAQWVGYDDDTLAKTLQTLGLKTIDAKTLQQARTLFAHAVETPGGLKIQTIHAFCERVLHLFPFEANVAAQFNVLDSVQIKDLIKEAQTYVLHQALQGKDSALSQALDCVAGLRSETSLTDLLDEAWSVLRKANLTQPSGETLEMLMPEIARALGIHPDASEAACDMQLRQHALTLSQLQYAYDILSQGSRNETKMATRIANALTAIKTGSDWLNAYLGIFQKSDGGLYSQSYLITAKTARLHPDLEALLMNEAGRLELCLEQKRLVQTLSRSRAVFTLSLAVGDYYNQIKSRRGALDFDDLIERTLSLLHRSDAAWVLFKLDQGIDHLLVDEAQDTSPAQWNILKSLTDDFFAGETHKSTQRTVFAVGDPKQSIYSFQGAAPRAFAESATFFETRIKALPAQQGGRFNAVELQLSFRSSETILRAVDAIFQTTKHHEGLDYPPKAPAHEARRADLPGRIEIWPLIEAQKEEETEEWVPALKADAPPLPSIALAQKIAQTIADWCLPSSTERIHELDPQGQLIARPIRAGDILILVRKRSAFFEAMIRALKDKSVPVAGADRLSLLDHMAIKDLVALGQACLLVEDDLALASVLKSPLFNLTDDDLMALAPERSSSLYHALQQHPDYSMAVAQFDLFRGWASHYGPFGFYARVLNEALAREALLSRLGLEAADAIDAFLNAAQDHEYRKIPSLHHFLNDFIQAQTEIKRDMEAGRNEVRVMTVHGAKGLESPIVFLPDTTSMPDSKLLTRFPLLDTQPASQLPLPVWSLSKSSNPETVNAALDATLKNQQDEYRRLLYVALTRARERLYIAGFKGTQQIKAECWYEMIRIGLSDLAKPVDPASATSVWQYSHHNGTPHSKSVNRPDNARIDTRSPVWLRQPIRIEQTARPPIKPSHAFSAADHSARMLDTPWQRKAQQRGILFHRLLELLPQITVEHRETAARNLMAARGAFLSAAEQDRLWSECAHIFSHESFGELFGPTSQAEVSISGTISFKEYGLCVPVTGQIDRIAITENRVFVCDYKTSLIPPDSLAAVNPDHIIQIALYKTLLSELYPQHRIIACLLYTATGLMIEVPEQAMQASLVQLAAREAR